MSVPGEMALASSFLARMLGRSRSGTSRASASIHARSARIVRAAVDAARTTDQNRRHWANADGLGPNAALSSEIRRVVRERARYEAANNSYARGITRTFSGDVVGTGPRLQMLTDNPALNSRIEAAFSAWSRAIGLGSILRTMHLGKVVDGEAFAKLTTNPGVGHPVTLDVQPIEPEQVASPLGLVPNRLEVDGIIFDGNSNPIEYRVLDVHPGDSASLVGATKATSVPAARMLHLFRVDRAGQRRGLSEISSALPLFAQLRRYTLAVLAAAETAARFAGVLQTDSPAEGADDVEPLDAIELEANMLLTLPGGWKMGQVESEQPTTTYGEFKRELINEAARCLGMPFGIAAADSSKYNYASGRLDHQGYWKTLHIERQALEAAVLDRILAEWLREARIALELRGLVADSMDVAHAWFWPGHEHVDPVKEAAAQATRLASHTTTLAAEYARQGLDWEQSLRQRSKELELMRELGLSVAAPPADKPDEDEDDDKVEEEEEADAA